MGKNVAVVPVADDLSLVARALALMEANRRLMERLRKAGMNYSAKKTRVLLGEGATEEDKTIIIEARHIVTAILILAAGIGLGMPVAWAIDRALFETA